MHRIALISRACPTRKVLALWRRAASYGVDLLPVDELGTLMDTERPDLILFDYDLPSGRGPDALASLRNVGTSRACRSSPSRPMVRRPGVRLKAPSRAHGSPSLATSATS